MINFETERIFKSKAIWIFIMQIFIFISTFYTFKSYPFVVIGINLGYLLLQISVTFYNKTSIGCNIDDNKLHIRYVYLFKIKVKEIPINNLTYSININPSLRGTTLRNLRLFEADKLFIKIDELDINEEDMDIVISYFKRKIPEKEITPIWSHLG